MGTARSAIAIGKECPKDPFSKTRVVAQTKGNRAPEMQGALRFTLDETLAPLSPFQWLDGIYEFNADMIANSERTDTAQEAPSKLREAMKFLRQMLAGGGMEVGMEGLKVLIGLDREWVPEKRGFSLYIRPFIFATENFLGVKVSETYRFLIITGPVGAYYKEGINPVKLTTPGEYVRASKGGLGAAKTPANYAATLLPAEEAKKKALPRSSGLME